jgi:thiol-disulfide isomerase/thioredoxin
VTGRTGLTRRELIAASVVVALVVVGAALLWPALSGPRSGGGTQPSAPPSGQAAPSTAPGPWDDAALEPDRRAAGLPACPTGDSAPGPLGDVLVPCLGAPGMVRPAAGLAGRDALVNFFGSWCEPCRAELPALAEYAERPDAVPVLEVDVRDRPEAALALLADLGVRLPAVADTDGVLAAAIRLPPALPASYLLHADGRLTQVLPPVPFHTADEVAAAVARARSAGS